MRTLLWMSKALNIIAIFAALTLMGPYGCGGGGDDGSGDDDGGGSGTTITAAEADEVATGSVNSILAVVSRLLFGDMSPDVSKSMGILAASKAVPVSKTISVTESSSTCDGGQIAPVYGSQQFTIYGSDLSSSGSGTCRIDYASEFGEDQTITTTAMLDFLEFTGAEATNYITLDGTLSLWVETTSFGESGASAVATSRTPSLLVGFIQDNSTKICEIVMSIIQSVSVLVDAEGAVATSSITGCISVCDEVFEVSGNETQTFTLP